MLVDFFSFPKALFSFPACRPPSLRTIFFLRRRGERHRIKLPIFFPSFLPSLSSPIIPLFFPHLANDLLRTCHDSMICSTLSQFSPCYLRFFFELSLPPLDRSEPIVHFTNSWRLIPHLFLLEPPDNLFPPISIFSRDT